MVARLRAKPGGDAIGVTIGDFATAIVDGHVLAGVPGLQHDHEPDHAGRAGGLLPQRRGPLEPGGCFVIETGVPDLRRLPPGEDVLPWHVSPDPLGFDSFDLATQAMRGHYVDSPAAKREYRTMPFRYVWPAELDLMARLAGMRLRDRWAGWAREPFTGESRQHVSIWEKLSR